ncbi:competence type IV pilus major pilin ComGC [Metabacillus herbersteinensis]|uniref:ComG operon protein 3 n=1 Tax=Metabacillus herbersteinensis TaxID=283816 RepID=A0ABV6GAN7_9BACI
MKNEKGFTLVEMLIVLLVISILLLITIPNITKHNANIQDKGCKGLTNMVQAQATAYMMDENVSSVTIAELKAEGYLSNDPVCPNGNTIVIDSQGKVSESVPTP